MTTRVLFGLTCKPHTVLSTGEVSFSLVLETIPVEEVMRVGGYTIRKGHTEKTVSKYLKLPQFCPVDVVAAALRALADAIEKGEEK